MATSVNLSDDLRYRLLKLVESTPQLTQREAALHLGVSVGKVNYCLNALIGKGWVKARNFTNNRNKFAYMYLLTPKGIEEKLKVTYRFLDRKVKEYEELGEEVRLLNEEVQELRKRDLEFLNSDSK